MPKPLEERFWEKVTKAGAIPTHRPDLGPCWLWSASRDETGYGYFWMSGKNHRAHTVSYALLFGDVPKGLELDHLCRNRSCVNPAHLEPVTHAENMKRGQSGAQERNRTHCPQGHPYEGRNLIVQSNGKRHCRACGVESSRRRYWANRRDAVVNLTS